MKGGMDLLGFNMRGYEPSVLAMNFSTRDEYRRLTIFGEKALGGLKTGCWLGSARYRSRMKSSESSWPAIARLSPLVNGSNSRVLPPSCSLTIFAED